MQKDSELKEFLVKVVLEMSKNKADVKVEDVIVKPVNQKTFKEKVYQLLEEKLKLAKNEYDTFDTQITDDNLSEGFKTERLIAKTKLRFLEDLEKVIKLL